MDFPGNLRSSGCQYNARNSKIAGIYYSVWRNMPWTKWYVFYGDVIKPVIFAILASVVCLLVLQAYPSGGWIFLCGKAVITVTISVLIGYYVILSKLERNIISSKLLAKIKRIKTNI